MKRLYLYISLDNDDLLIGSLFVDQHSGKDVFYFEYDDSFLKLKNRPLIDPLLSDFKGQQYQFNFINDMIPDRFGMKLIERNEQQEAIKEQRPIKKLTTFDYLVRVNDLSRMGALRIKEDLNGGFISSGKNSVPPYLYLRDIEAASIKLEEDGVFDEHTYHDLLLPGSSLGGARPKANIYYNDEVYLAKFPSKNDTFDVELWEYIVNQIAKELGLNVPEAKLDKYSNYGHTLLLKRFDRDHGKRIHYISGVTALGTTDGNSDKFSYLDLVNFVNVYCVNSGVCLKELYKRMLFTYLINNTDNHLRNHAFLLDGDSLTLTPMFDVNPTFYFSSFELKFGLGEDKNGLIELSDYFHVDRNEASQLFDEFKEKIIVRVKQYALEFPEIKNEARVLIEIISNK